MSKVVLSSGTVVTVIHTMADGTVRDSIKGYEIPYNENTKHLYQMRAEMIMNAMKRMQDEEEKSV